MVRMNHQKKMGSRRANNGGFCVTAYNGCQELTFVDYIRAIRECPPFFFLDTMCRASCESRQRTVRNSLAHKSTARIVATILDTGDKPLLVVASLHLTTLRPASSKLWSSYPAAACRCSRQPNSHTATSSTRGDWPNPSPTPSYSGRATGKARAVPPRGSVVRV